MDFKRTKTNTIFTNKMVKTRDNGDNGKIYAFHNGSRARRPYNRRGYSDRYHYFPQKFRDRGRYNAKLPKKAPPEPPCPVEGSEEFTALKIQKTSAIIMRQLLSPDETEPTPNTQSMEAPVTDCSKKIESKQCENVQSNKKQKPAPSKVLTKKEIIQRIMNRIANLNDGRKKNFINTNNSTMVDNVLQQILKNHRLENSRVVRDSFSSVNEATEPGEILNELIAETDINIADLPLAVIEGISRTLNINFDIDECDNLNVQNEACTSSGELQGAVDSILIKSEKPEQTECVEIKLEDIAVENSLHESVDIKDDILDRESHDDIDNHQERGSLNFSMDTVLFSSPPQEINGTKEVKDASTQTIVSLSVIEELLKQLATTDKCNISNLREVNEKVGKIEKCTDILANHRRSLFKSVLTGYEDLRSSVAEKSDATPITTTNNSENEDNKVAKKRKSNTTDLLVKEEVDEEFNLDHMELPQLRERAMVIERVKNMLLVATESGNIIYISLKAGVILHSLDVSSDPITCMILKKGMNDFMYIYTGGLDQVFRVYDLNNKKLIAAHAINDKIQCMDSMWGYVFIGCKNGTMLRYSCNKERIEFEERNVGSDILVIKAAQEGPRKVLLVGHRQAPIFVRDAMSGLYLRNFSNDAITPTVYSLIIDNSFLYCGTAKNSILVFSFHEGKPLHKLFAADCMGISCMRIMKNYLFAGCYNGDIYVYNLKTKMSIASLKGPGGGILCMEVLSRQVIVGTITGNFNFVELPEEM